MVLEVRTDPNVPPLPSHITLDQAKAFTSMLTKGDPEEGRVLVDTGKINPHDPEEREIPDFHIGTDPAAVKLWGEEMGTGLGYGKVVWDSRTRSLGVAA